MGSSSSGTPRRTRVPLGMSRESRREAGQDSGGKGWSHHSDRGSSEGSRGPGAWAPSSAPLCPALPGAFLSPRARPGSRVETGCGCSPDRLFPAFASPPPPWLSPLCLPLHVCACSSASRPLTFPFPPTRCPPAPLALAPPTQQSLKADSRPLEGSPTQLPILADMLLYYCRFAARPVLLQVYQTEVSACRPSHLLPGTHRQASLTSRGPSLCPVPTPWQPPALSRRSLEGPCRRSTLTPGLAFCS